MERQYLADKLQAQIEWRQKRLKELNEQERWRRYDDVERQRAKPLRRSKSREKRTSVSSLAEEEISLKKEETQASSDLKTISIVFETEAEKEAAARRRRVIEMTAPKNEENDSHGFTNNKDQREEGL